MLKAKHSGTLLPALLFLSTIPGRAVPQQARTEARQEEARKSGFKCAANLNNTGKSKNDSLRKTEQDKQYVGSGTCRSCHSEISESFDQGPHGKIMTDTCALPKWQNCETCHGPGRQHADTGGDQDTIIFPPALSPEDLNQRCLSCHEFPKGHDKFIDQKAAPQRISCLECHSVHNNPKVQGAP